MRFAASCASFAFCLLLVGSSFAQDTGSWKISLVEKEQKLTELLFKNHWNRGIYASDVIIDQQGRTNFTPASHADVTHSVNWTSYYLCGLALMYQVTKDPAVLEHLRDGIAGLLRLNDINGVPGLWSRGYLEGHGPSYEERRHEGSNNYWKQGVPPYEELRYRGHPSHHTYSGVSRALCMLFDFAPDEETKDLIRTHYRQMLDHVYLNNNFRVINPDGSQSADLLMWPPHDSPTTHGLFVTSALRYGLHILGEVPEIRKAYEDLITQHRYREFADKPLEELRASIEAGGTDNDDGEHAYGHLYNLARIEKDETMVRLYRKFAEALWTWHHDDRQPWYHIVQNAVLPGSVDFNETLSWYADYPTDKVFKPRMNSLLNPKPEDLPLSINQRPFDNEYDFKGNPFRLDGYLARTVTDVEISADDPKVMFAIDTAGYLYRSYNGGGWWEDIWRGLGGAKVRDVAVAPNRYRRLVAATDRGLFRSDDAGTVWFPVDALGVTPASWVIADGSPSHALFAQVGGGVYQAVDHGEENFGKTWKRIDGVQPPGGVTGVSLVADGDEKVLVGLSGGSVWKCMPGGDWELLSKPRFVEPVQVASDPFHPSRWFLVGSGRFGGMSFQPLFRSDDRGGDWQLWGMQMEWSREKHGKGSGLEGVEVQDISFHPDKPDHLMIAGGNRGAFLSTDGGTEWKPANDGLDIPVVNAVSSSGGTFYAGTPGGLARWTGEGWEMTGLVPQFTGCERRQTGPADFLAVYWFARYHGLITEEQASLPWEQLAGGK